MFKSVRNMVISALQWSEKYTRTNMLYVARGGFWSLVSQGTSLLIALAVLTALGHFLPQDVYGQYKYVLSFVTLISAFSFSGLSNAVFQSVSRGFDGALIEGFWLNLRWSFLIFIAAVASFAYYATQGNTVLGAGILIGGLCFPIITSSNLYTSFLSGKKDFARRTLYGDTVANIVPALILVTAITITNDPLIVIAVYFISNAITDLAVYRYIIRLYRASLGKRDAGMFAYGRHLSVMGIFGGIANNIDQIILFHFAGAAQLAVYSFAVTTINQVKGQQKNLDMMTQAQFASRSSREIVRGMPHKMMLLFAMSLVGIVSYILLAPYIYTLLFPHYLDSIVFSQVYALSFLGMFALPAGSYLTAKKHVRELYIDNVVSYALQIGLMAVGAAFWGLWGLIIARVVTRLMDAVLVVVLYWIASKKDIAREQGPIIA